MNRHKLIVIACPLLLAGLSLRASDSQPKIEKGDIPKNEKKLWLRIGKSQKDIEENLMSGDPRFTAELDLTRRKVADLMLDAEGDKKNKAVVKDLSRCWNYWVRETDEIVREDMKEYTLATAAGKSFDPADNNPQGGNPYIGTPLQYVPVPQPQPQAYYAPPSQPQAYYVQPPPPVYPVGRCLNSDGSFQPGCIPPQGANGTIYPSYAVPQTVPQAYAVSRAHSAGFFAQMGLLFKAPEERSGSTYRGTGQHPPPATRAAVVARATGKK